MRSSQDDRVRLEGLAARSKDAERLAAELATTKLQLQSTSSLLKDARTELRVATVGPHPVMEFTRSQPSRLNASADHGFLSVAEVDRVYPSYHG